MIPAHRLAVLCLVAAVVGVAACAKTQVTDRETPYSGRMPKPNHIWVYDFVSHSENVPAESALAGHPAVESAPQTPEQIELGRKIGTDVARELVAEIQAMGLPAEHAASESRLGAGDLVIRGYLLSVEAGSELERVAVGMGKGNAELKTAVEGFLVTAQGLRKLGGGTVDSGGSKTPGSAVPLAVAIATHNPLGLIVSTGVKLHAEKTGAATIQGKAEDTAKEIAMQLEPRFREQGWIP